MVRSSDPNREVCPTGGWRNLALSRGPILLRYTGLCKTFDISSMVSLQTMTCVCIHCLRLLEACAQRLSCMSSNLLSSRMGVRECMPTAATVYPDDIR